ncbi:putative monogalactosyldiacylglycerol synthase, chloroplastic [Tetrabaena socialis]|uniref:Cilia- and flagella-associated protein 263 n=1 Tax=Tetrabaena socialis TaxID=47790 RepID=A0A2J7ZRQ0_9CHLO|nr:putative monogalactosyldiacylglycerol synthase, chloroplastic [Tetrabaena socialis]|eukprot:PNH02951.1 putative monogalactosyldiacylglycerol synthase, chloroplastic [Tetrabaena socialis]
MGIGGGLSVSPAITVAIRQCGSNSGFALQILGPGAAKAVALWPFRGRRRGPVTEPDRKRILIGMSNTGGGHKASAEALKAACEERYGDKYEIFIVDLWKEHTPPPFNTLPDSYSFLVHNAFLWRFTYEFTNPKLVHVPYLSAVGCFISRGLHEALDKYQPHLMIRKAGDKDIDDIRTLMEEVDMRIAETKKDTYEFKRDIIIGAENTRTSKIIAEKMIRFMEDKLRQKDATADKLRLKNTTTKALITKLEHQLAHKEEMGEVLHLVDFDQLKIENQQYMERIEERNNELLKLKLSTSRTVQVLNNLKSQLSEMVAAGHQLRRQITERRQDLARFDSEYSSVLDEKGRGERTVRRLKLEQEDM